MFTHLFRLIWNKKKQNFLLLLEIFISFIGLFAGFTFMLYPYNNRKMPDGFSHENVWSVQFSGKGETLNIDSLQIFRESLKKTVLSINGVEEVTYSSGNIPYSGNRSNNGITYNGNQVFANIYTAVDSYKDILGLQVMEGRWFSAGDNAPDKKVVVINDELKKKLFGEEPVIGKIVKTDANEELKIIGVVAGVKDKSPVDPPSPGIYQRMDTGSIRYIHSMMIKVRPDADAGLESRVFKTISNSMRNDYVEIEHLTQMRESVAGEYQTFFIILLIVAAFLIINVALGIFGVLWYNINKRKGEIGLRRAVGATGKSISWQLVTEAILLATLSLILGSLFAVQFPLLNVLDLPASHFITAIILSIVFIYVLVILCALYPGKQAAAIYPAVALHED